MATLGKIRSKSTLLIAFIGVALFAFVIGDFLNPSNVDESAQDVISIEGEKVKIDEFTAKENEFTFVYQYQQMRTNSAQMLPDAEQIRQGTYDDIVRTKLIEGAAAEVGITVSNKELKDLMTGDNMHRIMQSSLVFFPNETELLSTLNQLDEFTQNPSQYSSQYSQEDQMAMLQLQQYRLFLERVIKSVRLEEKYTTLLSATLNTNSLEAKFAFDNAQTTVNALYVTKPYSSIADSTIVVTDSELKNEYKQRKEQFKQEKSRDLQYISFPIRPSAEDFEKVSMRIAPLREQLASDDVNEVIELISSNSDVAYPTSNVSVRDVDPDFAAFAFTAKKDSVMGPILSNNTYKMARIMSAPVMAPDSVYFRNILLRGRDEATTEILADSIVNALRGGANFAALAQRYSVSSSVQTGGEVGWQRENQVGNELIVQWLFYENTTGPFALKTLDGMQILEAVAKTTPIQKVRLAVFSKQVTASNITYNAIHGKARDFVVANNTPDKFVAAARDSGLVVRPAMFIQENMPRLDNIEGSREVIRWAFTNDSEIVSDVFTCGNEYIVCAITAVREKGYSSIEDVEPLLRASIVRDKKAVVISDEFSAKLAQNSNIQSFASSVSLPVDSMKGINFATTRVATVGNEPAITAIAQFLTQNQLSSPIKGNSGVFVLSPYEITKSSNEFDATMQKNMMNATYKSMIPQSFYPTLLNKADVEDFRFNFY